MSATLLLPRWTESRPMLSLLSDPIGSCLGGCSLLPPLVEGVRPVVMEGVWRVVVAAPRRAQWLRCREGRWAQSWCPGNAARLAFAAIGVPASESTLA